MNYDVPARVVWEANLDLDGVRSNDALSFIDPETYTANVTSEYSNNQGNFNKTAIGQGNTTNVVNFAITDGDGVQNRVNFNFSFSSYKGPVKSATALLGTNYIDNYTAYNLYITLNSNNDILGPAFSFDPEFSGSIIADKSLLIPAGAKNYPINLWCSPNAATSEVMFNCAIKINGLPSSQIVLSDNRARWTFPS